MNSKPNISIIIPVYNVEEYIEECIDSVINQTLTNIEIIIVNDGSTDNSLEVIKKYNDNRIKLINKVNGGLSSARNRGIIEAIGDYILFLDSDDFLVNNDCLKEAFKLVEKKEIDMVECEYDLYKDGMVIEHGERYSKIFKDKYININEYIDKLINTNFVPVCFKIFKRQVIINNNLNFKEGFLHEDEDFTPRVLLKVNNIAIYNKSFYGYRIREGSITRTNNIKRTNDLLKISCDLLNYYNQIPTTKNIKLLKERAINIILEKIYTEKIKNLNKETKMLLIRNSTSTIHKISSIIIFINTYMFRYVYWTYIVLTSIKNKIGGRLLCQENN